MELKVAQVEKLIDDLCSSPSEKFKLAKVVFQKIAKEQGIHEDKLIPGGLAEQVICEYFNLIWNKGEKKGIDARMKDGRSIEIKSSNCPKKSNIMYDIGFHKSENKQQKCNRIFAKYKEMACHSWFIDNNKCQGHHYIMILPGEHMALLIYEILKASKKDKMKINFGGAVCKICNLIHRHVFLTKVFGVPKLIKSSDMTALNTAEPVQNINWEEVAQYFTNRKSIEANRINCEEYLNELTKPCIRPAL